MKNESMRGLNPDQSRPKSLYFLLQATARTLPITKNQRDRLNKLMPSLMIEASGQEWVISFRDSDLPVKVVPKASFNFYKHSDDIEIAKNNKIEAYKVLQDLFPDFEINVRGSVDKDSNKIWREVIFSKIIPIFLILLLLTQQNNLTVFRASLISLLSILLFKIESIKLQLILTTYSVTLVSFFPNFYNSNQIVFIIYLLVLIILNQISTLVNQKESYYWTSTLFLVVTAIALNQSYSLPLTSVSVSMLLVITLVVRKMIRESSTKILVMFFIVAIFYTVISFLENPTYSFILRLIVTLPCMLFLTLRNRSNGLIPYLATYSGLLTA